MGTRKQFGPFENLQLGGINRYQSLRAVMTCPLVPCGKIRGTTQTDVVLALHLSKDGAEEFVCPSLYIVI